MPGVRTLCAVLLSCGAGIAAGPDGGTPATGVPPVLRNHDPVINVVVRLPGPAPDPAPARTSAKQAPNLPTPSSMEVGSGAPSTTPTIPISATAILPEAEARPGQPDDPPRPRLRHIYPPSFEQDSALFCQRLIGQWADSDARFLLGEPTRHREAFDDNHVVNGNILAFSDPTGRYRELELDFEAGSGTLRTVFAYPWKMSWQDARKLWGPNVTGTSTRNGRKFFSYLDRRLDVLVDQNGRVISVGLY